MGAYFITFLIGLGATGAAFISGFLGVEFVIDLASSPAPKVRSRVRALAIEDRLMVTTNVSPLLMTLATYTAAGWPARAGAAVGRFARVLDRVGVAQDERRLGQSGLYAVMEPVDMVRVRAWAGLLLGGMLFVMGIATSLGTAVFMAFLGFFLGVRMSSLQLARAAADRMKRAVRDLPEMIDIISLGTRAGMSFDRCLELYCERFQGPLPEEFGQALQQWQYGALSRDQALTALGKRLDSEDVDRFIAAVLQGLRLGSPLAKVLADQAEEARTAWRLSIQEQIGKAPIKMLGPMAALILPAMLIMLLGPVLLSVMQGGL